MGNDKPETIRHLRLKFHGGADEVTGSRHLLDYGTGRVMLDCGLFQGHRHEALERNATFPAPVDSLDAVLLSHAHIDHSGALPLLVKNGFSKTIHCTEPTAELLRIMLMDSAFLQEEDAKFFNKIHREEGLTIEPLYTKEDVEKTLPLLHTHKYQELFEVAPGVRARFLNAGHVLGSAMIMAEIQTEKGLRRVLFTGDLGRREPLLMTPPSIPSHVDYLLTESTYGGRHHEPVSKGEKVMAEAVRRAFETGGRILIPSFALERTQEIVYLLEKLRRRGDIPPIHLYVDSPMAADITDVFMRQLQNESLSKAFKASVEKNDDPFGLKTVRYIRTVDESKKLNETPGPKIILSASGMCEGGRILHHLRNTIEDEKTTILLVGYQAQGTLGRRLLDGQKKVKIFGLRHEVWARIDMLDYFSSHADRDDLLWFVKGLDPRPRRIFLVHGDATQRESLRELLNGEGISRVVVPKFGEEVELE